jgi:hypothetical protein
MQVKHMLVPFFAPLSPISLLAQRNRERKGTPRNRPGGYAAMLRKNPPQPIRYAQMVAFLGFFLALLAGFKGTQKLIVIARYVEFYSLY